MSELSFESVFGSAENLAAGISGVDFLLCCLVSVVLGTVCACVYMFRNDYSKSFAVTLVLLPVMVQAVITLVNGNLGAGVAVMGVFSLVRFRSVPGSARDIASVFFAMSIGLATGMGFLVFAIVLTAVVAVVSLILAATSFGCQRNSEKLLHITVPEDLSFEGVFDPTLQRYASDFRLVQVQTTNMGALYQLDYRLRLRGAGMEKPLIDELRCLNGNLKIVLGRPGSEPGSL